MLLCEHLCYFVSTCPHSATVKCLDASKRSVFRNHSHTNLYGSFEKSYATALKLFWIVFITDKIECGEIDADNWRHSLINMAIFSTTHSTTTDEPPYLNLPLSLHISYDPFHSAFWSLVITKVFTLAYYQTLANACTCVYTHTVCVV